MQIQINNEINPNQWNSFSENKIFFRYEWLNVIQNSYSLEPYFVLCHEDDKFALIASFKTHKGYISLPFVSYSGFLSNDKDLLLKLKEYLKEKNIEIDSRDLLDEEPTEGYVNPILEFSDIDDFWKKVQPRFRSLLRKSEKNEFTFKEEKSLENFYKIYTTGMRNLGTPTHGMDYFKELVKYLDAKIFTIFDNEKAIGSMFCLTDENTLCVMYTYVYPEYSKDYANYSLYLNVVKWMCENNLTLFDLGRSTFDETTYHFKKKFRPKFYKINSKINYSSDDKLQLASKIWSKFPLCFANFLGPKVRKYLP